MLYGAKIGTGSKEREWAFMDIDSVEVVTGPIPLRVRVDTLGATETFDLGDEDQWWQFCNYRMCMSAPEGMEVVVRLAAEGVVLLNQDRPDSIARLTVV